MTGGILKVNDNRLVWSHGPTKRRLARIDLTSKQLEILIAAEVSEWLGATNIAARLKPHENLKMLQAFARDQASADSLLPVFQYPVTST